MTPDLFPQPDMKNETRPASSFDRFWAEVPVKVGKLAARRSFKRALHKISADQLLEAYALYKAKKPDWQAFCHPATWLNGERWNDQEGTQSPANGSRLVPVSRGSPEWSAWLKAGHKATLVLYAPQYGPEGGWSFPTRYPHGEQPTKPAIQEPSEPRPSAPRES